MTSTPSTAAGAAANGAADCCSELGSMSRRGLLRGLGLAGATTMFGTTAVTMTSTSAGAATTPADSVIVVLSLRGAADGLSLVVPHGDPVYYQARPRIAVAADKLVAKDGFFGLHPELSPLLPLWNSGKLAAVHATGMAVPNRSHFAAMEVVEDANPGSAERAGWLNRLLGTDSNTSPLQAVAVTGSALPTSLYGPEPVMSFSSLDRAKIAGDDPNDKARTRTTSLATMWDSARHPLGGSVRSAMKAVNDLGAAKATADNKASYPKTSLGAAMSNVARTLRGDVGVGLVTVDHGGWDMHTDLGTLSWGRMISNNRDLAGSIAAFFNDLGPVADKVTLVTISEFGRRVVENANHGLDHGWGNAMFVAGAGVKGGKYYGKWTALQNAHDADLKVTTDYRSVLSEIVATRTSASTAAVFPGFQPESVGVMTSL